MNVESPIGTMPDFSELTKRLGVADATFDAWRNATSDQLWNSIDLSAVRIGYELGKAVHAPSSTTLCARPIEWVAESDGGEWSDNNGFGFHVSLDDDGSGEPYSAAWGEGDSESFATLEEAQAWCQETIDSWLRENAIPKNAQASPGLALVASERRRQVDVEGWTPEHDDEHKGGELADAAACYADAASAIGRGADPIELHDPANDTSAYDGIGDHLIWPWDPAWLKLSPDPIRNLVKAGALIIAEIDRLKRAEANQGDQA
jgi:hypothetical protein